MINALSDLPIACDRLMSRIEALAMIGASRLAGEKSPTEHYRRYCE